MKRKVKISFDGQMLTVINTGSKLWVNMINYITFEINMPIK